MPDRTSSGNFIELQDLWKTSYPVIKVEIPTADTTTTCTSTAQTYSPAQTVRLRRHRPTPLSLSNLTSGNPKTPSLPFHPTSPLPALKSPYLPSSRPKTARSSRHFRHTKAKIQRVTSSLHTQIRSKFLRKIMIPHTQRAEKKQEAKRLADQEFHRNWDSMSEEKQAAYTKQREEARVRERRRLEDIKNGSDESRKSDAKSAAVTGAIVVCL